MCRATCAECFGQSRPLNRQTYRGYFHLGTDRRACRPPIARCVGRSRVAHALVSNETPTQEILSSANYPTRQCRTPAFAVRLHTFANASPRGDNNRPQMFLVFFSRIGAGQAPRNGCASDPLFAHAAYAVAGSREESSTALFKALACRTWQVSTLTYFPQRLGATTGRSLSFSVD